MFRDEIGEEIWNAVQKGNAEEVRSLLSYGMVDVNLKNSIESSLEYMNGQHSCVCIK